MKIYTLVGMSEAQQAAAPRQKRLQNEERETQSAQKGDQVSVSSAGKLSAIAMRSALDASDVRTAKVQSLQHDIQAGTYHIDSEEIAQKLLEADLELYS